jgi:hypothetical protein
VGDIGGFGDKLDRLEELGLVGRQDKEILKIAVEAGHAATHRGYAPEAENVNQVMDIVEHLIEAIYVLGGAAKRLKKAVPKGDSRSEK